MTPARRPADGFAEHWENPYTHAQMDAGPEALCGESARLAAGYLKAAAAYWEGRSTKEALAACIIIAVAAVQGLLAFLLYQEA